MMFSNDADVHAFGTENCFNFVTKKEPNTDDIIYPRGAHIRKTNPRDDSAPPHRIIRRGIPYGSELSVNPGDKRGLVFVCYQSRIDQGFQFIQQNWANNPGFPFNSPPGIDNGLDPVIGQKNDPSNFKMTINTPIPGTQNFGFSGINQFVIPRGGNTSSSHQCQRCRTHPRERLLHLKEDRRNY